MNNKKLVFATALLVIGVNLLYLSQHSWPSGIDRISHESFKINVDGKIISDVNDDFLRSISVIKKDEVPVATILNQNYPLYLVRQSKDYAYFTDQHHRGKNAGFYKMDLKTHQIEYIKNPGKLATFEDLSEDESLTLWQEWEETNNRSLFILYNTNTKEKKHLRITSEAYKGGVRAPRFSPDAKKIVYLGLLEDRNLQQMFAHSSVPQEALVIVEVSTGKETEVVRSRTREEHFESVGWKDNNTLDYKIVYYGDFKTKE